MQHIRIAFTNFYHGFDYKSFFIYQILRKHFDIDVVKDNPDFVISSVFGDFRDLVRYDAPRLLVCHEPMLPDFTLFDYAVGFAFMSIDEGDRPARYYRFPTAFENLEICQSLDIKLSESDAKDIWRKKTRFCDFIYGHESVGQIREHLLDTIIKYKHVDSVGRYLNNTSGKVLCKDYQAKWDFQRQCRFSIISESMQYPGFVTEKIVHAFYCHTIPIYIGDPLVTRTFNKDAMILASDYRSEDELLRAIAAIDNGENLATKIIAERKYANEPFSRQIALFERWLIKLFSQETKKAYRRPTHFRAIVYETFIRNAGSFKSWAKRVFKKPLS